MHQHDQNKLIIQQQQKSVVNLTEGSKLQDKIQHLLIIKKNILTVLFFGTNL